VLQFITKAVEMGQEYHIEYRIIRSDGAVRWVEGCGQIFRDPEGRPERMVGQSSPASWRGPLREFSKMS